MKELEKFTTWLEKRRQEQVNIIVQFQEHSKEAPPAANIAKLHTLNMVLVESYTMLLAAKKEEKENKQK